jgi:tetratricopeptide (TPR) repeat protein
MRKRPWDASLYSDKAISEYSKGAVDAAVADLRTANRLDPRFMPAYLTLGAVLTSQGRAREAVAAYDDALSNAGDADRFRPVIIKTRQEVLAGISR